MDHVDIFSSGVGAGIAHLDYLGGYYSGLNPYVVEYDPLKKDFSISSTGVLSKLSEEPLDKYMQELVEEMRLGLRTGNSREHIKNVLLKFSDRKFKDKAWWGNLTDIEVEELLSSIRAYYLPHTAMLNSGLREAFIFGKFSKQLTESTSLANARNKVKKLGVSAYDKARIDCIQKTSKLFWDKAIKRESDSAAIKLLQHNRDVTTKILENPDRKSWRSLTTDIYDSINKDKAIVLRDMERITLTELAYSQNSSILMSGHDRGEKYFFVRVRPTACKKCKEMYLEGGRPKKFLITDFLTQPRDINWGKRKGDTIVDQPPPLHGHCFCKIVI